MYASTSSNTCSLVIFPSLVVCHWLSESQCFSSDNDIFPPFDFPGDAKSWCLNRRKPFHKCNITITRYSMLTNDVNILEDVSCEWIILDKGQLLKKPKTCKLLIIPHMCPILLTYQYIVVLGSSIHSNFSDCKSFKKIEVPSQFDIGPF